MSGNLQDKDQWVIAVYDLLCKSQGAPANEKEKGNLMSWAASMAEGDSYSEGLTPEEAHDEEMSCR
jgi:hypothetical protein